MGPGEERHAKVPLVTWDTIAQATSDVGLNTMTDLTGKWSGK